MRPVLLVVLGCLAATALASSCTSVPAAAPRDFLVEYETGSIPPPFNHAYTISGRVQDGAVDLTYDKVYRYRDQLPDDQLDEAEAEGSDVHWDGTLAGAQAERWITLLRDTRVVAPPTPMPGSDRFVVRITFDDGREVAGLPEQREAWETLVAELDEQVTGGDASPAPAGSAPASPGP